MNKEARAVQAQLTRLLESVSLVQLDVRQISLDRDMQQFLADCNPVGIFKSSADDAFDAVESTLLDAYQSPLLVFESVSGKYQLASGIFTYQKILKAYSERQDVNLYPCHLLPRKPNRRLRRLMLLNDVTRPLLKQFIHKSGHRVTELLTSWFTSAEQPSVFASLEWQILFPRLKTKTQLCEWLHISTKTIKLR